MSLKLLFAGCCFLSQSLLAQENDTTKITILPLMEYKETRSVGGIEMLPDKKDNVIYAAKKHALIRIDKLQADLSINNTRQIFGKIPGMSIWENDGSGIQQGIAARGLSPNRSWEFNIRQNGVEVASDIFGYPEAYYAPPMEAVETIEVLRGAASLQYGPQFGGMINYKIKKGNPDKIFSFETQQTVGSYGTFNTFNAIGGTYKKFSYYGFIHHRTGDGWRQNANYKTTTGYLSANYKLSKKINIGFEYSDMQYKSRQAGGLTDQQFNENHRQSVRGRNWFSAPFKSITSTINYAITEKTNMQLKVFGNFAERNSVGYTKAINIPDSINPATGQYAARQVDRDRYENYGAELRLSTSYKFFTKSNVVAFGLRAYKGNTYRNQLGTGTNGADFDLSLMNRTYGRSMVFQTLNYAAFAEHIFYVGKRFKIVPGVRYELIENQGGGYFNPTGSGILSNEKRNRNIFLYGVGAEFRVTPLTNIYANYSRAFRPVTFSELTPSATTEIIDPALKDASGFNADIGYRGVLGKWINFDIGLFYLNYNNRIGIVSDNGIPFRTNIGTSESMGIESYIEFDLTKLITEKSRWGSLSLFASNAFIEAYYSRWDNPAIAEDPTKSIKNKKVENAPSFIHRFGTTYNIKKLTLVIQYNYISEVYTDAANTVTPNASATIGKLPAYQVIDATLTYNLLEKYIIKAGVNNLNNEKYATRRSGGYPGPGILPGNGRTYFVTFGAKF